MKKFIKWPEEQLEDITPKLNTFCKWVMLAVLIVILFTWIAIDP